MKKIIDFIGSFKFAVIILALILALSVIGSFIPQNDSHEFMANLANLFGTDEEQVHRILDVTGFLNIYSSPFFVFLIFLFGLSIVVRTYKLLPFAFKGFQRPESVKFNEVIESNLTETEILGVLRKNGWKNFPKENESDFFMASKHSCGRFGVIILHLGIIVVMFGAMVGYFWGFNGFINLLAAEGYSDNVAVLPDGKLTPIGFDIACDNFTVEYYDNSTRAKAYTSVLSVIENGKKVKTATVDVNHPFKYKNIVFYQTNFGIYRGKGSKVLLDVETKDGSKEFKENFESLFNIQGGYTAKITDFAPDLAVNEDGKIYSASKEMLNPAVLIEIYDNDKPALRAWILKNSPMSGDFQDLGFKIQFKDLEGTAYTGLSVKKDPGTPFIYIGFLLVVIGVLLTYLFNYTAVFFEIDERGDRRFINYSMKEQRKRRIINPSETFKGLFVKKTEK